MFIKENEGQFVVADSNKPLRYKKFVDGESVNSVVFNPQPKHFQEAGYREVVKTPIPETLPEQYIETIYELKGDKYYEVHTVKEVSL